MYWQWQVRVTPSLPFNLFVLWWQPVTLLPIMAQSCSLHLHSQCSRSHRFCRRAWSYVCLQWRVKDTPCLPCLLSVLCWRPATLLPVTFHSCSLLLHSQCSNLPFFKVYHSFLLVALFDKLLCSMKLTIFESLGYNCVNVLPFLKQLIDTVSPPTNVYYLWMKWYRC